MLKNWCFQTAVLEKTLESPLDNKEIQPVNPKGNQSWILLEGLMLKLKLQYFGHLMQRADSFEKTLIEDWRWEEKGMTEDEMVGWHHQLKGLEFEQTQGNSEGQGNLACYSPWHHTQKSQTWLSDWTTTTMPRQRRLPNIPQKPEIPLQLVASLLSSSLCTKTIFILSLTL